MRADIDKRRLREGADYGGAGTSDGQKCMLWLSHAPGSWAGPGGNLHPAVRLQQNMQGEGSVRRAGTAGAALGRC